MNNYLSSSTTTRKANYIPPPVYKRALRYRNYRPLVTKTIQQAHSSNCSSN